MRFGAGDAAEAPLKGNEPPEPQEITAPDLAERTQQRIDEVEEDLQSLQIDDPARFEELLVEREIEFAEAFKN